MARKMNTTAPTTACAGQGASERRDKREKRGTHVRRGRVVGHEGLHGRRQVLQGGGHGGGSKIESAGKFPPVCELGLGDAAQRRLGLTALIEVVLGPIHRVDTEIAFCRGCGPQRPHPSRRCDVCRRAHAAAVTAAHLAALTARPLSARLWSPSHRVRTSPVTHIPSPWRRRSRMCPSSPVRQPLV
jgi:hypothetical protein